MEKNMSVNLIGGGSIPLIGFGPDSLGYVLGLRKKMGSAMVQKMYNKLHYIFFDKPQYVNAIASSFTIGYKLLDYSASYGDGKLLKEAMMKAGISRKDLIITTRISNKAQFEDGIDDEIKKQLEGFGTDYIDILMFHWPVTGYYEDTWKKMIKLKEQGLCKTLGVANCNIHHLKTLYEISEVYPEINQVEVHPLFTQVELRRFCKEKGIVIESYSPTARHDDRLYNPRLLNELSKKYERSITQLILRWHIQNDLVPVIRSWNPDHLKSDFDIFDFEISPKDMEKIDNLNINSRIRYDPDNCDFYSL